MARPSVLPIVSKTFLRLAQIHSSLFILACTKYRRPSRQSDWTFMSSSMRLDVTRVCLQRASGWMKPLCSGAMSSRDSQDFAKRVRPT